MCEALPQVVVGQMPVGTSRTWRSTRLSYAPTCLRERRIGSGWGSAPSRKGTRDAAV